MADSPLLCDLHAGCAMIRDGDPILWCDEAGCSYVGRHAQNCSLCLGFGLNSDGLPLGPDDPEVEEGGGDCPECGGLIAVLG